jgi:geranylgeranyl pyrophosphate synthase
MATLVHDDLVDGARMRRGVPSAWSVFGVDGALSAGDYLFACAFAELADTSSSESVAVLADACLALARGEAMQRSQTRNPDTTIADYLERCALKTGKLFEAACLLGSGGDRALGEYGLALGIAFQIADDILDCAGQTQETGKIPGTDLREGTPTMPLLYAAQQDETVRAALAGGPLDGALARVAATDALERSRDAALDYASKARSRLGGEARRVELESLTYAVVDRAS